MRPFFAASALAVLAALCAVVLRDGWGFVGLPFEGALVFANGLPGRFSMPSWDPGTTALFSRWDYLGVVVLPAVTGLLFAASGAALTPFLGRREFFLFHWLVGAYLVLSPDFHLRHRFVHAEMLAFVFVPAAMLRFASVFPEGGKAASWRSALPYAVSAALAVPYLALFRARPSLWSIVEIAVVAYLSAAYLFWMVRLASFLRRPQRESDRSMARSLLRGQLAAFSVPFAAAVAVFAARAPIPLNLAAPVVLLFPAAVLVGVLFARLHESRLRLASSERLAVLGNALGGIAHELKNPLNFIVANFDALKGQVASREGREIVADMEEGADRMRAILDDFRTILEPEASRKAAEPVDLNDVVVRTAALLKPRCRDRVAVNLVLGEIPRVPGRRGELGQAALNLLANAVDAVLEKEGEKEGDKGEGEVSVTTEARGGRVLLTVKDNGPGISPENLKRIFDPFFTTKPQGRGTGLGLALTERIVRDHSGRVEVISEPGKGSEFVVTLPVS